MNTQQAIETLVREGAAFVHSPGAVPLPVGLITPVGPLRWFWWEVGGDTEFHGHVIECDRAEVLYGGLAVKFTKADRFVGYLTSFAETYDDEADATAADRNLSQWRAHYLQDQALRGFIVQQTRLRT